jgi:hypothetical protein
VPAAFSYLARRQGRGGSETPAAGLSSSDSLGGAGPEKNGAPIKGVETEAGPETFRALFGGALALA